MPFSLFLPPLNLFIVLLFPPCHLFLPPFHRFLVLLSPPFHLFLVLLPLLIDSLSKLVGPLNQLALQPTLQLALQPARIGRAT